MIAESIHSLFGAKDLPEFLSPSVAAERLSVTWQDLSRWHKWGFGPERFSDSDGPFYRLVDIEAWEDESGWLDLKRCYLMSDPNTQLNRMRMKFRKILVDVHSVPKRWKNTQEQWIHTHGDVRRYLKKKGIE